MDKNAHPLCAVILTALPVEYQAVRAHLADVQEETHPEGNVYERGIFTAQKQHWEVGIVETQMGTARAAFEAGRAIEYFKPSVVLFVGIAGGIKDVKIGDVVAATKVYGYESGKASTLFQPRPEIGLSSYRMTQRAQAIARNAQWMKRIQPPPQPLPRARVAPIAAGDKVVSSTRSSLWWLLKQNYGDALAVEMEGYGFLQAVHGNSHIEALVVRGISDLIEGKSEADAAGTQEIAACNASAFAFEVLAQLSQDDLVHPSRAAKGSSGQPGQPPNTAAPIHHQTSFQNDGSVQDSIFQGGSNNTINQVFNNTPTRDETAEGRTYLKRGQNALASGNYSDARRYLDAANLRLQEDQFPQENAQVQYLQALTVLQGKRPFNATVQMWYRIEELIQAAIALHAAYSYIYTYALFQRDFARNGLRKSHYLQQAQECMERTKETPLMPMDDDNIALLWKCQPILMQEVMQ